MKTKIAYVLTSTEKDVYLEQAYVSMYSLKRYNPTAHVVLFVDRQTQQSFTGVRQKMIQYVDELVVKDFEEDLPAMVRSRLLKSSLRNYVDGDFLFIDTDTIVVKNLEEIDNVPYEIAACQDTHAAFKDNPFRSMCIKHGRILGWPIENEDIYYNSGVIYVKDCDLTRQFYKTWNDEWIKGEKKGVRMDQPAFAKTNYLMGHVIHDLDDYWNCELRYGIRYLKDARIVHYLGELKAPNQLFVLYEKSAFLPIKENAIIPEEIKECIEDPFKGLARVTVSVSGNDVFLLLSPVYFHIREKYGTWLFRFYSVLVTTPLHVKNLIRKIAKKFPFLVKIYRNYTNKKIENKELGVSSGCNKSLGGGVIPTSFINSIHANTFQKERRVA